MTIRNKMLLAMTLVLAFVTILAAIYHQSLNAIHRRMILVESIDDLRFRISDLRRAEKNYLLYHDQASAEELLRQVEATGAAMRAKAPELAQLQGAADFARLRKSFATYKALAGALLSGGSGDPVSIREEGRALYETSRNIVSLERERIEGMIASSRRMLAASILFVIIAAAVGAFLIGKDIVAPLGRLERATRRVSGGDYAPIKAMRSHDEIGSLVDAFNNMVGRIERHQEELVQAGKLSSLGTLVSGVAHELNNPLNNISMMAQTAISLYDTMPDRERIAIFENIESQCERTRDIVSGLLDFSRLKGKGYEAGDIGAVIKASLKLVQNQLSISGVETRLDMPGRLPQVDMNANKIKQVLINIFTNAVKAMPSGGVLSVEASQPGRDRVRIKVSDTGRGMTPEELPHIFDPFFTTGATGEGTGLGLSVSYGIIKRHGGSITAQSEPGQGSVFTVELPIHGKERDDGEQAPHNGG